MKQYLLVVAALLASFGCDEGLSPLQPDGSTPPPPGPETTYHEHVAPLVARECLGCHVEGGIGPFPLDTYEAIVEVSEYVVPAVMTGYMPPWLPDRDCREFDHQRGLTMEERQVFERWVDQGMARGNPADEPPLPPPPAPFTATHVAHMTEPYTPSAEEPDDYRCFLLDQTITEDSYLTGRNVVPDAAALVHHVLVYGVPEAMVSLIEEADAADAGPGYTCFGGPVPTADDTQGGSLGLIGMGGWVPGQVPFLEREGRGVYLPAGTRIVMQVHYNLLSNDPAPDMTEYHMQLTTEAPERLSVTFPTAILELNIRAGEPVNRHQRLIRNYGSSPLTLTGFTPHMHLLGTEIGLERVAARGASAVEECLIDVPRWDFNWQQSYRVRDGEEVTLAPGEGLVLTCNYDNSPSRQPVINGEQVEPRNVTWGEGTLDEMCLLYVQHEVPLSEPPGLGCEAAAGCLASCTTDDAQCLLACEGLSAGCRVCNLRATLSCASENGCRSAFGSIALAPTADYDGLACLERCIQSYAMVGGSFDRCMETECAAGTWATARDCVAGVVEAGTCDAPLAGCGITR